MKNQRRPMWTWALGLLFFGSLAHLPAQATDPATARSQLVDPTATGLNGKDAATPASLHEIRVAVRLINQAALQRNFASDGQIRALLQSAHDKLAASEPALCCVALEGVAQLDSDIRHMVARVDIPGDMVPTPRGASIRPPNREELNLLAKEGQNLLRDPIAQSWTDQENSFAAARNAAPLPKPDRAWLAAGGIRRVSPTLAHRPEALPMLSVNF